MQPQKSALTCKKMVPATKSLNLNLPSVWMSLIACGFHPEILLKWKDFEHLSRVSECPDAVGVTSLWVRWRTWASTA